MEMNKKLSVCGLFSGIGGFELGFQRAGYDIKLVSECDPFPYNSLKKNFPDSILVDDVAKITKELVGDVDVMCGGFPCFPAGSLVLTRDGHKQIQDIVVGDIVLTHTGNWKRVIKTMNKPNAQLRQIIGGGQHGLQCTDDHPFYTRHRFRKWNTNTNSYKRLFNDPQWVNAKDIIKDTFIGSVQPVENIDNTIHESFMWVVGRFLADGWVIWNTKTKARVIIAVGINKHDEFESNLKRCGLTACRSDETPTCSKYHITNTKFAKYCEQFGRGASNKYVPGWVFDMDTYHLRELFNGYMSGDGTINKKTGLLRSTTVSEKLSLSLQMLWERLGGIAYITKTIKPPTGVILGRTVNINDTYTIAYHTSTKIAFTDGIYKWKQIRNNNIITGLHTVYNLTVECDNSYTVNNIIVHNCTDISIGNPKNGRGLKGETSGPMWNEFKRILSEIRPKYAVVENVYMLRTRGLAKILNDFAEVGYDVTWTTLDSQYFGVPQRRRRMYLVGVRDGIEADSDLFQFGERDTTECRKSVDDFRSRLRWNFKTGEDWGEGTPIGTPFSYWTRQRSDQFKGVGLSSTLMKRDYKDFTDLIIQNGLPRRVTPKERLLLQGFDDTWLDDVEGYTNTKAFMYQGGTVPVMEYIAELIKSFDDKHGC